MERKVIQTDKAPAAIGPYSQAIEVSGSRMLFISGQLGLLPNGEFAGPSVEEQARQAMKNLLAILDAAGMGPENVVRTTIFLKDLNDFAAVNQIYGEHIGDPPPARATVQVSRLPKDGLVEIDAIAVG
ncbi:MAG: reactive intermediate/imine deaminase [Fimbriimonadales bacterium]|nr:MAG: reactive intermediate/imine deaminase [Fimbriimonadales bacterium]